MRNFVSLVGVLLFGAGALVCLALVSWPAFGAWLFSVAMVAAYLAGER